MRTAALAGLLAVAGLVATADRADAQVYYSNYPASTYYYNTTPFGGYQTYSYYTPATTWAMPGYTYNSYYTMPYTAWNGATWTYPTTTYYTPGYSNYYNYNYNYRWGRRGWRW
jgi:hypothetical protein